jgi:16S rRNA (guanine527-N7)-methyltransferase
MVSSEKIEIIRRGFEILNLACDPVALRNLDAYLVLLSERNRLVNMTSIPEEKWIEEIVLDSMALLGVIRSGQIGLSWADLGSGAGIPGMIIGLGRPSQPMDLIEPRLKRTLFLEHVCSNVTAGNIRVIRCRCEDLIQFLPETRSRYAIIFARALGSVELIVKYAIPLLSPGGWLVLPRGESIDMEWTQFRKTHGKAWDGFEVDYELPFSGRKRHCLILFRKEGS